LAHILRKNEFEVLSERGIFEKWGAFPSGQLVLVIDEKVVAPQSRLSLRSLRIRFPKAKLLVLAANTPHAEQSGLLRGIDGLVLYSDAQRSLVSALRALSQGHVWLPRETLEYLAQVAPEARERKLPFTSREAEVIRLIEEGLSNKEIGTRLGITEKTVKFHASNVFAKLGVHDRNTAIEVAHTLPAPRATCRGQLVSSSCLP
jgi:DNA-binding NarL/FixJ family response regulator